MIIIITAQLCGYHALYLAIRVDKATVNTALFAVGLAQNIYRSNYRKYKEKSAPAATDADKLKNQSKESVAEKNDKCN